MERAYCFNCEQSVNELYALAWPDGTRVAGLGGPLCFKCAGTATERLPRFRRLDMLQHPPEQRAQEQDDTEHEHGEQQ